ALPKLASATLARRAHPPQRARPWSDFGHRSHRTLSPGMFARPGRLSGLCGPDLQVPRNQTHTVGDRLMATVWERAMVRERAIIESLPPRTRLDLVMKAAAWTREALPEEHKKLLRRRVGATLDRAERFVSSC